MHPPQGTSAWGQVARVLRRQAPVVVAVLLIALLLAAMSSSLQRPLYTSSAEIALESPSNASDVQRLLFGESDLGTQQRVLTSRALARTVLADAGLPSSHADAGDFLDDNVNVQNEPGTTVLRVSVRLPRADEAARLAQGFAEGYIAYVRADASRRLDRALGELKGQESGLRQQLASVQQELAARPAPEIAESLERDRDQLYAQLRFVAARATELRTTNAFASRATIIEPAAVPREPSSPRPLLNLLLAGVLGLLLGGAAAVVRDRFRHRISNADVAVGLGVGPVLGVVPADGWQSAGTDPALKVLRTRFLARMPGAHRTAVLVPVDHRTDAAAPALGLAFALVRSGRRVALVDLDDEQALVGKHLGIAGSALSDVVGEEERSGRASEAWQQVRGVRVLASTPRETREDDALATPGFRALLDRARRDCDIVLLVASSGSSVLELGGGLIDEVMLVARVGASRAASLRAAVEDVHQVEIPSISVLLTRGIATPAPVVEAVGRGSASRTSPRVS